ncbi:MAG: hypothetical protein FJ060_09735 [Cyanobacteria bacterium K_Offshore_0m_m2_072]|nr:hypothetical protein [Cyanobacteria bacterium K_Offshore_0m_m2_072]
MEEADVEDAAAGFLHLPGADQRVLLTAAAAHLELAACVCGVGLQLLNEQAVIKGGTAGVEATEKINALGEISLIALRRRLRFPVVFFWARQTVLHPALLRPFAALVVSVAALGDPPQAYASAALPRGLVGSGPAWLAQAPKAKPTLQGKQGNYSASVFVAAPPQRAWAVLVNYEAMAGVMPDIKEAKVLRRTGPVVEVQQTYQAPYTFGRRITAVLSMRESAPRQLSYELVRGDQIRELRGTWTITPVSGGVIVRHQIKLDPEIPGFVRPLYYELSEANLRQSMAILKRLMEQD